MWFAPAVVFFLLLLFRTVCDYLYVLKDVMNGENINILVKIDQAVKSMMWGDEEILCRKDVIFRCMHLIWYCGGGQHVYEGLCNINKTVKIRPRSLFGEK